MDYLTGSIWFHSVLIGALVPNAFLRVVARRAANSSGQFVSDWEGFIRFAVGAFVAVLLVYPVIGWLVTGVFYNAAQRPENVTTANVAALIVELVFYHRYVLGRRIF